MSDRKDARAYAGSTVDVRVPFRYVIVHGGDSSLRSAEQKANTINMNLTGLTFETDSMDQGGFHLSFTESTFGRNSLEIKLDLGKKLGEIEVLGQVEWYERRHTSIGQNFVVGVSFIDMQADELAVLREFMRQAQSFNP
ncbi:MAG: PilZ domain-containing protein [Thermodesulfobacteriota bacterium]